MLVVHTKQFSLQGKMNFLFLQRTSKGCHRLISIILCISVVWWSLVITVVTHKILYAEAILLKAKSIFEDKLEYLMLKLILNEGGVCVWICMGRGGTRECREAIAPPPATDEDGY